MRAVEGDIVTLHWKCINDAGEVLESSRASDAPTTFEVGAGDVVGNRLFEAFDEAVRGMAVGESLGIKVRIGCIRLRQYISILWCRCMFFFLSLTFAHVFLPGGWSSLGARAFVQGS